ncbi:DUF3383 family protein [Martelella lutilitoris]|uniref:DUF3383 family protein n=1 Tax=Martelella lutilitoris TaxID=2583532 RepID=A0A7T7HHH6_9HYPH|nr:DUF3383 family protein [Martelella lutilitoris]QQM29295.1 DUF3383 family protein [Martelella lutilitoris]
MAKLPYSMVVNVSVDRVNNFPTRRGFGTILFLSTVAKAGIVDATTRTKLYASIEEVAVDWAATDDFYKAALAAFSQNPRPTSIKAGYISYTSGTSTESDVQDELDAIEAFDGDWYFLTIDSVLRDEAPLDGLISWNEAKMKQAFIDSNDDNMESAADTTNVAARNKGTVIRTSVFYHTDAAEWLAICAAAYCSTRVFDDANSAYTLKFKGMAGVQNVNLGSAAITAITGFVPGTGQSETAGHCANTYIDIGDQNFLVEGSTLTQNTFIDEIHASDWIVARTEEKMLSIFLNNARVPFSDVGMQILASGPREIMQAAVRAGIVPLDINTTGDYEAAYTITVPSVFDVPASQRNARIAPAITVVFRYAGAVHYATVTYELNY